jgi:hypothetical protein
MVFIFLVGNAFSYFCHHTVTITTNSPLSLEVPVGDGDYVCVNSTIPYITVVFQHTNLLSVRYFLEDSATNKLSHAGSFNFPSEASGVFFGNENGHIEIQSFLPGVLSFAVFAFPADCGGNRFVSTLLNDQFILGHRFRKNAFTDVRNPRYCFWSPHPHYIVIGESNPAARDSVFLCSDADQCTKLLGEDSGKRHISSNGTQFLEFNANSREIDSYVLGIHVKGEGRYLDISSLLSNDATAGLVTVVPQTEPQIAPGDDSERKQVEVVPEPVQQFPVVHRDKGNSARPLTPLEVLSVLCVCILSCLVIVQCCLCPRPKRGGKFDESEERLLEGYPPGLDGLPPPVQAPYGMPYQYYPQPIGGYGMPYQMPAGGVFFPTTPPQEAHG